MFDAARNLLQGPRSAPAPAGGKDWVNFAKGIAIILVIAFHCTLFLRSIDFAAGGLGRPKTAVELFPMPMFFAIAGLFHFRVLNWTFRQTWQRRLAGYLYLYVLWSVLRFLFYLVVPNVRGDGAGVSATSPTALAAILVWPISSYWFIWSLFLCTVVLWAVRRWSARTTVVAAALVSTAFSAGYLTTGNVGWDRTGEYLVFFLVGALFSKPLFAAVHRAPWWVLPVSFVVYALCAGVAAVVPGGQRVPGLVLAGQGAVLVFSALLSAQLVRLRVLGWVSYLGARSLHLYLMHIFVIAVVALLIRRPGQLEFLPGRGVVVLVLLTAVVTVLTTLLGRALSRVRWLYVPPRLKGRGGPKPRSGRGRVPVDAGAARRTPGTTSPTPRDA